MENYVKKLGRNSLIISILFVIVSLLMITKSVETINIVIMMFGYVLVTSGLIHIALYLKIDDDYRLYSYELAEGIINILLGLIVVGNVKSVATILPIALGIWIILEGILTLQVSLNIRGIRNTSWGIMCFMSLVSIALGFAIMMNPIPSFNTVVRMSGVILLITQIIHIYDSVYFLTQVKKVDKAVKKVSKKS